jgi:hypothetical protein
VRFPAGSLSITIARPGDLPDGVQVAADAQAVSLAKGQASAALRAHAVAQSSVTASINDRRLLARLDCNSVVTAALTTTVPLSATAAGHATVQPAQLRAMLAAAPAARSTLIGFPAVGRLFASLQASAQAAGALSVRHNLAAQAQAAATLAGALLGRLRAAAQAVATLSGTSSDGRLFGAFRAVATLAGLPRVAKPLAGAASDAASATGHLMARLRSACAAQSTVTGKAGARMRSQPAASASAAAHAIARIRAAAAGQASLHGGLVRLAGAHPAAQASATGTLSVSTGGSTPTGSLLLDGEGLYLDIGRLILQ